MPIIHPAKSLRDLRGVRHGVAKSIQPNPIPKASGRYDESIAVPFPDRVAIPCGLHVVGPRTPVGEDLPVALVVLVENHKQPRSLDDFPVRTMRVSFRNADRQTPRNGLVRLGWLP